MNPRKGTVNAAAKAVAFTILEYSKEHMIDVHYNVVKAHFGPCVRLLMTDTDSLIYEFKQKHDIIPDFADLPDHFDVSGNIDRLKHAVECSEEDLKRIFANEGVLGLLKPEELNATIVRYVGLCVKMYAFQMRPFSEEDDDTLERPSKVNGGS